MGRIFISAGHGAGDPGITIGGITEAQEMILLRNQIVTQLGDRGFQNSEVLSVPDNLSISGSESATFGSARLGVRAHIQHLKAYGSKDGIYPESKIVDPRFRFVAPGSAPTVEQLTERWSARKYDPPYGTKILNTLKSLYKSINLL